MFEFLADSLRRCAARVRELGGQVQQHQVAKPASPAEIDHLRKRLGGSLPLQLELLLSTFSKHVEFRWQLEVPDSGPPALRGHLLWGEFDWQIRNIDFMHPNDYWWAEEIVEGENPSDWLKKVVLCTAPDGDLLAIGLEGSIRDKPVYIAHDGVGGIDRILGDDLESFFRDWQRSGFLMINAFDRSDQPTDFASVQEYLALE